MTLANDLLAEQLRRNLESRGQWPAFANHRNRVTTLLMQAAQSGNQPRLCLLGAGNCNDVDLRRLLSSYSTIDLADCDAAAMIQGIQRQQLVGNPAIVLHGDVDLLGLQNAPDSQEPSDLIAAIANHQPLKDLGSYDVAASLCLLSQLIEAASRLVRSDNPRHLDLIQAIRRRHLELLVELLKPGGRGLLITDLISSASAPQLQTVAESQLAALVATCISERNFFTGLNPAVILDLLQRDFWFTDRIATSRPTGPWKWDFGPRSYAVYAIEFCRRSDS